MARQWKWITEIRKNSQPLCSISLLRLESSSIILFLLNPVFRWFSNVLLCGSRLLQNRPKLVSSWCFRLQVQLLSSTLCSSFVCCGQSFNRSEHPAMGTVSHSAIWLTWTSISGVMNRKWHIFNICFLTIVIWLNCCDQGMRTRQWSLG